MSLLSSIGKFLGIGAAVVGGGAAVNKVTGLFKNEADNFVEETQNNMVEGETPYEKWLREKGGATATPATTTAATPAPAQNGATGTLTPFEVWNKEYEAKNPLIQNTGTGIDEKLNKTGPGIDIFKENQLGANAKQEAMDWRTKLQKNLDFTKKDMAPEAITQLDQEKTRTEGLLSSLYDSALNNNNGEGKREIYSYLANSADQQANDTSGNGFIFNTQRSKDASVRERGNNLLERQKKLTDDVLAKYDDDYVKNNKGKVLQEMRDAFENDQYLMNESEYGDEKVDTLVAEGKYDSIKTDSFMGVLKKAYYGFTLGQQEAKENVMGQGILQGLDKGPLQAVGVVGDVGAGIRDTIKDDVADGHINPAIWLGNVLGTVEGFFGDVVDRAYDSTDELVRSMGGNMFSSTNRYRNSIQSQVDNADIQKAEGMSKLGKTIKSMTRGVLSSFTQDMDDVGGFVGSMLVGGAVTKGISSLGKGAEALSYVDRLKNVGAGGRVLANIGVNIMEGLIPNTYFNTMAGVDFSNKQAVTDIGLDLLFGGFSGLAKEGGHYYQSLKTFNKGRGEYKTILDETAKATGNEVEALKATRGDYLAQFGDAVGAKQEAAEKFDTFVKATEEKGNGEVNLNALKRDTQTMQNAKYNLNIDEANQMMTRAEIAGSTNELVNKYGLEKAQDILKQGREVKLNAILDSANKAKSSAESNVLDKPGIKEFSEKLDKIGVSTMKETTDVISRIDNAKDVKELSNIIYESMGGKNLADFHSYKAKTNVIKSQISAMTDMIASDDINKQRAGAYALNETFKRIGLTDVSLGDIGRGKAKANQFTDVLIQNLNKDIKPMLEKMIAESPDKRVKQLVGEIITDIDTAKVASDNAKKAEEIAEKIQENLDKDAAKNVAEKSIDEVVLEKEAADIEQQGKNLMNQEEFKKVFNDYIDKAYAGDKFTADYLKNTFEGMQKLYTSGNPEIAKNLVYNFAEKIKADGEVLGMFTNEGYIAFSEKIFKAMGVDLDMIAKTESDGLNFMGESLSAEARKYKSAEEFVEAYKKENKIKTFQESYPKKEFSDDAMYSYYEKQDETRQGLMDEYQQNIDNPEYKQNWNVVPAGRIKKIWDDYAKTGIIRDEKGLDNIINTMIENTQKIEFNNLISGHTPSHPESELGEKFNYEDGSAFPEGYFEKIESRMDDETGQWRLSDYGTAGLVNDSMKLMDPTLTAEEKLLIADHMLNIVHQRSDIAGRFIEGGRKTLNDISGTYKESEIFSAGIKKPSELKQIREQSNMGEGLAHTSSATINPQSVTETIYHEFAHNLQQYVKQEERNKLVTYHSGKGLDDRQTIEAINRDITDALLGRKEFSKVSNIKTDSYLLSIKKIAEYIKSVASTVGEMLGIKMQGTPGLTDQAYSDIIGGINNDFQKMRVLKTMEEGTFLGKSLERSFTKSSKVQGGIDLMGALQKFEGVMTQAYRTLGDVTLGENAYLFGHKAYGTINANINDLATVFDGYKSLGQQLSDVSIYKGSSEITDLSKKLDILSMNNFDEDAVKSAGYSIGKGQSLGGLKSTVSSAVMTFDGPQRIFMEKFMRKQAGFSTAEKGILSKFFGIMDGLRGKYNQKIIDNLTKDGGVSVDGLAQMRQLGAWMGNTDNKVGTIFSAMGISKRHMYSSAGVDGKLPEITKKYRESFQKMMGSFEASKNAPLNAIGVKFKALLKGDERPIEEIMDEIYTNIKNTMEDQYFSKYRKDVEAITNTDELIAEARKMNVSEDIIKAGDEKAMKEEILKNVDIVKDEAASRFLYNPLEYLGYGNQLSKAVDSIMYREAISNKAYGDFLNSLGDYRYDPVMEPFKFNTALKIYSEELHTQYFFDSITKLYKENTELSGKNIGFVNGDLLKDKLSRLFSKGEHDLGDSVVEIVSGGQGTESKIITSANDAFVQSMIDDSANYVKQMVADSASDDSLSFDTFEKLVDNVYSQTLQGDSKAVAAIFPEAKELTDPARADLARTYGSMITQLDMAVKSFVENFSLKAGKSPSEIEVMEKDFAKLLNDPVNAKKVYGELVMRYDETLGDIEYSMDAGQQLKGPLGKFVKFFSPTLSVVEKADPAFYSKLCNLQQAGTKVKMELTYSMAKHLESAGIGKIENGILKMDGKDGFVIGQKYNGGGLFKMYEDAMFKANKGQYKIGGWKKISDSEMKQIREDVHSMYKGLKEYAPMYDMSDKVSFVSHMATDFYNSFYEGVKGDFGMKSAYGFEKQGKERYVHAKGMKDDFFGTIQADNKKNTLRFGLNSFAPMTSLRMRDELINKLKKIGYDKPETADNILYKGYMTYTNGMNIVNGLRSFMYSVLFSPLNAPKTVQQMFSNFTKLGGRELMVGGIKDYKGGFLDYLSKSIDYDSWLTNKSSDMADGYASAIGGKMLGRLNTNTIKQSLTNALPWADEAVKGNVVKTSIIGAAQNLGITKEGFEELGRFMENLGGSFKTVNDDTLRGLGILGKEDSLLTNMESKFNNGSYMSRDEIQRLDDFIVDNYDKIDRITMGHLENITNGLKGDYNKVVKIRSTIKNLASGYTNSFFQTGMRSEMTLNPAGSKRYMQAILPLFNRATKEFASNLGDIMMDFSRIKNQYGSVVDMMSSKKFYAQLLTMPSVLNLSAQLVQFSLYFNKINKVIKAQEGEENGLDYTATMKGLLSPLVAAMQVMGPEVAAMKAYGDTRDMGASQGSALTAMTNSLIGGYMSRFAKEGFMFADWMGEAQQTYAQCNKAGLENCSIGNIALQTMYRKATGSVIRGTVNAYRGDILNSKGSDLGQAFNLAFYGDFTEQQAQQKRQIEKAYVEKNYKLLDNDIMLQIKDMYKASSNIGILNEKFFQTTSNKGFDALIDGGEGRETALESATFVNPDMKEEDQYKPGQFATSVRQTLQGEGAKGNSTLKGLSQAEITDEKARITADIMGDPKLGLLSPEKIIERTMTYRSRFSSSFVLGTVLEEIAKKQGKASTESEEKGIKAQIKATYGSTKGYTGSDVAKQMDAREGAVMDKLVKQMYPDLVKYNKQVGMTTYMLAAKNAGISVAKGAYDASISLDLFEKSLKSQGNYTPAMSEVKNYRSMLMSTYNQDYTQVLEKKPEVFVNMLTNMTKLVDKSNTDEISKLYVKGGMLRGMGDMVQKVFEASPELATKYKKVAGAIARDMLQNSNRLSYEEAKKAAIEDIFGESGGKGAKGSFHKMPSAHLKESALAIMKAVSPDLKFSQLPKDDGGTKRLPGLGEFGAKDYNLEGLKIKGLTTGALSTADLTTPGLKVASGKVTASRVKGMKSTGNKKLYERAIKG